MIPTYLDLPTGRTAVSTFDIPLYVLSEGNWSCDCNRSLDFEGLHDGLEIIYGKHGCFGSRRIVVIDVSGDLEGRTKHEVLELANESFVQA